MCAHTVTETVRGDGGIAQGRGVVQRCTACGMHLCCWCGEEPCSTNGACRWCSEIEGYARAGGRR